ncbi:MAG: hotdog fold thioesterase [Bacteroidetes bacterium]|nr:hotdog fold thioesterase [Bacteroidota bacterium]
MTPEEIVNTMMSKDYFSQWLGITVLEIKSGYCRLKATVKKEMLNGFGIAHGGFTYSVADSALAFSSNSQGRKSVSIETSISHITSLKEHDEIIAEAMCETQTERLGHYKINLYLSNDPEKIVALFKGIVYKTSGNWD